MTGRLALALVAGALLVAACGDDDQQGGEALARDRMVVVPRIVGLPESQAECVLERAGLRWRAGDSSVRAATDRDCDADDRGQGSAVSTDSSVVRQRPRAMRRVRARTVVRFETKCTLLRFKPDGAACQ